MKKFIYILNKKIFYKKFFSWFGIGLILSIFIIIPILAHVKLVVATKEPIAHSQIKGKWQQVPIGGGGYVTGVYVHPQAADLVYMHTDNGGAYRWLPKQKRWQNIVDRFPRLPWNYYGVEALALDVHNPDLVYLALGKYTSMGNGKLWKSSDRGNTWVESDLKIPMGGDEDKRWGGHRLAVSPHDSNYLLFGSRTQGLWKSNDGGLHWSQVTNFRASPRSDIGLNAIAFDPIDSGRIYISAYGDGIYQSNNAGWTWAKMPKSPVRGMKIAVASDRSVYVTNDTSPGVNKYVHGVWQDITPAKHHGHVFNALSVHPQQPQNILVALGDVSGGKIFYSSNGGKTWKQQQARPQPHPAIPWWPDYFFNDHTSAIAFDPHYPGRVWLSDWFGVWRTENYLDQRAIWSNYPQGHEQLVTLSLLAPPQGAAIISGVADMEGFYHHSLTAYPQDRLGYDNPKATRHWERYWQDIYGLAYCYARPSNLVKVGGRRDARINMVAISRDGGLTWQELSTFPDDKIPLKVAISAKDPAKFVVIRSEGQPLQTSDFGRTWQQVSGLPDGVKGPWNWNYPLAADGLKSNYFFYYAEGTVYRSKNGGITFQRVNNSLPSTDHYILQSIPGKENELWLSLEEKGLWVSKDGGVNFNPIPQVKHSRLFSWGKSRQGDRFSVLYLYGEVSDLGEGLFQSSDRGKTWQKLDALPLYKNDSAKTILVLEASRQEAGLVFLGTDGRGIYYRYFGERGLSSN